MGMSKPAQPRCQVGCNMTNIRPTPDSYGSSHSPKTSLNPSPVAQIGIPLDVSVERSSRRSSSAQITEASARPDERALQLAPPAQQPTMVFLIKVDGVVVVTTDP
jgi:hypothetical protein